MDDEGWLALPFLPIKAVSQNMPTVDSMGSGRGYTLPTTNIQEGKPQVFS